MNPSELLYLHCILTDHITKFIGVLAVTGEMAHHAAPDCKQIFTLPTDTTALARDIIACVIPLEQTFPITRTEVFAGLQSNVAPFA